MSNDEPKLTNIKSENASVTWKNFKTLELDVKYVSVIKFYEDIKRWKFDMVILNKNIPLDTYIEADINITSGMYGYYTWRTWATCILTEEEKFECTTASWCPNTKNDKIIILTSRYYGSVYFKNSAGKLKFIYQSGFNKI